MDMQEVEVQTVLNPSSVYMKLVHIYTETTVSGTGRSVLKLRKKLTKELQSKLKSIAGV